MPRFAQNAFEPGQRPPTGQSAMDESRTERRCPDPACDWTLIEPTNPIAITRSDWREAPLTAAKATEAVQRAVDQRHRIVEVACEAHIREFHDAEDPTGWAERTVADQLAGTEQTAPQ